MLSNKVNMDRVFIIAEAGMNHNGDLNLAYKMIDVAANAKVDAVKFQTAIPELVIASHAEKAIYQKSATGTEESQLEMAKKLCLPFDDFRKLKNYCVKKGVIFLSAPFDVESLEFLLTLDVPYLKIPSGKITNMPYLERTAKSGKKIILSTGMSQLYEVEKCLLTLCKSGAHLKDITVLHCNTQYPTPYKDANIRAMLTLKRTFKVSVGFSDHTEGTEASIAAVALGATIIEKHFTLDKAMHGPDHKASLNPEELNSLVLSIRHVEKALGDGTKRITNSEKENLTVARKSIVAVMDINKGELFTERNIGTKRPGNGISPMSWYTVLGRIAKRNFQKDELVEI